MTVYQYYAARSLMGGSASITTATGGLVGEINNLFQNRDHASDGWIGDPSHAARDSDHNPDYGDGGIVRAVDIDSNGAPGVLTELVKTVLKAAIGDPRVYYVIWNRKIYSRTYGWVPHYYGGSNPHDHHVHISIMAGSRENDMSPWIDNPFKVKPKPLNVANVREQFNAAINGKEVTVNNAVGRIQQVLNRQYGATLTVDGIVGTATIAEWKKFEMTLPERYRQGAYRIPDRPALARMGRGHFNLVGGSGRGKGTR